MKTPQLRRIDDFRRNKRMRKGMFILPSLFTALNIGAGYVAIAQTLQAVAYNDPSRFDLASKFIGVAVFFDGMDGLIARMTNTASEFGKQLDSLADVITFGVAPALLAFAWGIHGVEAPFGNADFHLKFMQLGAFVTFLYLFAGASRLARFNIQVNPQPSNPGRLGRKYFVGMAIPAGAGVIASVVHFFGGEPIRRWDFALGWLVLIFVTGFLMVSTWRFYNPKNIDWKKQRPFTTVLLLATFVYLIYAFSKWVLLFLALTYMFYGIIFRLAYLVRRGRMQPEEEASQQ